MNLFIDLHNHLTWDVDDGIASFTQTCQLLTMAQSDGIVKIVATPHYIPGRYHQQQHDFITKRMLELKELANTYNIEVILGCEIFMNQDYLSMLDEHLFHTIGDSNYILVEFDVRKNINRNDEVESQLHECIVRGYRPIIAHVERYFHEGIDVKRIQKWIDMGCFIQVNRTSVLKYGAKYLYKNVKTLLENQLVHVVASDAHRVEGERICKMSDVFKALEKMCGRENAKLLCYENQDKGLKNQEMGNMLPYRKSIFRVFR